MTTENIFIEETPDTITEKWDEITGIIVDSVRDAVVYGKSFVVDQENKIHEWNESITNGYRLHRICDDLHEWAGGYIGDFSDHKMERSGDLKVWYLVTTIASAAQLGLSIIAPIANKEDCDPFNPRGIRDALDVGKIFSLYGEWIRFFSRDQLSDITISDLADLKSRLEETDRYLDMSKDPLKKTRFRGILQHYLENCVGMDVFRDIRSLFKIIGV